MIYLVFSFQLSDISHLSVDIQRSALPSIVMDPETPCCVASDGQMLTALNEFGYGPFEVEAGVLGGIEAYSYVDLDWHMARVEKKLTTIVLR